MATIPDEKLVESPSKAVKAAEAGAADPANKAKKKKKARKTSQRTQIATLRLQVATQLLAPTYGSATNGVGSERLQAAIKVANELLELNASTALPKLGRGSSKDKESKGFKEPKEGKGRAQ
jgi:hypothetical protein